MKPRWLALAAVGTLPFVTSAFLGTHASALEPAAIPNIIGEPVPSSINCAVHKVFPKGNGPFVNRFELNVAQWQIKGKRLTYLYPGQETFQGVVDPDGNITLNGDGKFEGRSSWRYAFKGRIGNKDNTVIHGQMLQTQKDGVERVTRDCTLTFLLDPSELRRRLASQGRPRPNIAAATLANDVAALKSQQADAAQQRQRDQERLVSVQSGQKELKSNLDATTARIGSIETGLILPADERLSDWAPRIAAIPVQQQQFCQLIYRYNDQLLEARSARNEVAVATSYRERRRDFVALLPKGQFENWVMRVVQVDETGSGNAAVVLQPPCRAILGNSLCRGEDASIGAIVPGTVQYRELEKVKAGDFVIVSGHLPHVGNDDEIETNASTSGQTKKPTRSACTDKQDQDNFAADISYVARMN